MKELSCKEVQEIELEMLRYFDGFAREHGLKYFLAGGTLLGAVRHKGFIPWDDDVDLMLPRKDYERLIEIFEETDSYRLLSYKKDPSFPFKNARIIDKHTSLKYKYLLTDEMGVFLDLFPIDGFPDSKFLSDMHVRRIYYNWEIWNTSLKRKPNNSLRFKKLRAFIRLFLGEPGKYSEKIDRLAMKYDYDTCNYAGVAIIIHYMFRERNRKEVYEKSVLIPFEDIMVPAPVGYDEYLTQLYGGNYMEMPPVEKRQTHHSYTITRKD